MHKRSLLTTFELMFLIILVSGCSQAQRYTSLDLDLLPCEHGQAPLFFKAVEFDKTGSPLFSQQLDDLNREFDDKLVKDLVLFIHGWNKNPSSAEQDYQNFLCRLHGRIRRIDSGPNKEREELIVLGVFWPSTITNRDQEPLLMLPLSYYQIRDRADTIGDAGLANVLTSLTRKIESDSTRLHLIGHSFGGRILVKSLRKMQDMEKLMPLIDAAATVNVTLVNAAISADSFNWIREKVTKAKGGRFGASTPSYLFNIHSHNDTANRILFPIASIFNDDPAECAAGACGVPEFPTLCVDDAGNLQLTGARADSQSVRDLNAWNIDATKIVFDHSDIYKGRVATLITNLLYKEADRERFPGSATQKGC
jgi:Alpha/beta hydrolase of unknown function (DUF900)